MGANEENRPPFRPVSWQSFQANVVPNCTSCGTVVDYLRSCYQSAFLTNSVTGASIQGRYYFSPPEAELYLGTSFFSSATWLDDWDKMYYLGDQFPESQWNSGILPTPSPVVTRRETAIAAFDCFGSSERLFLSSDGVGGFSKRCFRNP